jgi:predicted nucleic acid-binding protein
VVLDLSGDELTTFARLRDATFVSLFSLVDGLGRGEAAALAIAMSRGYDLATDDQDAINVAAELSPDTQTHRIRALLIRAADSSLISKDEARELHAAMVRAGFWDTGTIT